MRSRSLRSWLRLLNITGLPFVDGNPVSVSVKPKLTAHRGKLLSGSNTGAPVYAASFIRERRIVLESSLLPDEKLLRLVLVHEAFHFAWPRMGNPARAAFAELLEEEHRCGARGELGESSAVAKGSKQYACECFCDTGAYLYAGVGHYGWFTLAARWRRRRAAWFEEQFGR